MAASPTYGTAQDALRNPLVVQWRYRATKKARRRIAQSLVSYSFGPTGFEPAISCPPDRRDNQASLRPDAVAIDFQPSLTFLVAPLVAP